MGRGKSTHLHKSSKEILFKGKFPGEEKFQAEQKLVFLSDEENSSIKELLMKERGIFNIVGQPTIDLLNDVTVDFEEFYPCQDETVDSQSLDDNCIKGTCNHRILENFSYQLQDHRKFQKKIAKHILKEISLNAAEDIKVINQIPKIQPDKYFEDMKSTLLNYSEKHYNEEVWRELPDYQQRMIYDPNFANLIIELNKNKSEELKRTIDLVCLEELWWDDDFQAELDYDSGPSGGDTFKAAFINLDKWTDLISSIETKIIKEFKSA